MSHVDSSCPSHDLEKPCAQDSEKNSESAEDSRDDSAGKDTKQMSPESGLRERVLKEVGFTSTTFIGPAFLPETARVQPDMEDTLSQFYKELGKVDSADGANENLEKDRETPGTSTNEDIQEKNQTMSRSLDAGSHQEGGRQKQSWQHWYQNEPYPPRPKPSMDLMSGGTAAAQSQRHQPPPFNRPPNPRLHRPPYRHPPPPASFLNPQNQRPHMIPSWNFPATENQRQDESQFHPNFRFPSHASQDFYRDSPQDCEKEERRYSKETLLDDVSAGWCRDAEQQQRSETEKEVWEKQERRQTPGNTNARRSSLVLILMRGLPGSGKSTLAKKLLTGPSGLILSSDDYFSHRDGYRYDPSLVGAAHEWNQSRAEEAMRRGRSPIIIDNTNIQAWEMKPYVKMALEGGYRVDFCEPDTIWKFDPFELEKRNKHGVPQEKIAQMLSRFSFPVSIDVVMRSQEPLHVNARRRDTSRNSRSASAPQLYRQNHSS